MVSALLALGGNLGDVRATLDRAIAMLGEGGDVQVLKRSSDYRTPPWGVTDQPEFVNLAIEVETALSPHALLERIHGIEKALGRDRKAGPRWGPRPIDIDIIAYDDLALDDPALTLPHPRALERAFVLVPLAEIAPDRTIAGVRVRDAVKRVDHAGVTPIPPRLSRLI